MKKILLSALVSTVVVGSTFAAVPSASFNGFYVGGGLTYSKEKFNVKSTFTPTGGGASTSSSPSASLSGGGVKLFGGYGTTVVEGLYLGGELILGYDRIIADRKKDIESSGNKFNYSIAGRAGYVFSNVLPYVKFGYEGRPSIKSSDAVTIRRNGFILGGGVDVAVTKNIFIRGEYVHGFGAKSNISFSGTRLGVPGTFSGNVKTSTDTFLLGAAYKF